MYHVDITGPGTGSNIRPARESDDSRVQVRINRVCYLASVKSSVFYEDFIGVHAGYDYASEVDSVSLALQRNRISNRLLRFRLQRDTHRSEKRQIGLIA